MTSQCNTVSILCKMYNCVWWLNLHLRHCDWLIQVLLNSSSTCPKGHIQNAASHIIEGLGLLQVALNGIQPPVKICPIPGHGTTWQK